MHCLIIQDCFIRPGPPNFFMSLQKWHSPHSVRRQASHFRQRVLLRLAPDELRLDGSLTADDVVPILGFGRLAARCWKTNSESGWRLSVEGDKFIPVTHVSATVTRVFFKKDNGWKCNCILVSSSVLSCWSWAPGQISKYVASTQYRDDSFVRFSHNQLFLLLFDNYEPM